MEALRIVFFGSFQRYSVHVLAELVKHVSVTAVITTPPKPAGRHMELTPTPVQEYAQAHRIPTYPLESLSAIPKKLDRPDFLVVAGYGKLIPAVWLDFPKMMAINMHPSLLPAYRGAFPAEWAILNGEKETGVTLVKMSLEFDKGEILVQQAIPITLGDSRETLYAKLYNLGAKLLIETLPKIARGEITPRPQPAGEFFYARRLTREDGFESWEAIQQAFADARQAERIDRKFRALKPWPGLWTEVELTRTHHAVGWKPKTRLKILSCRLSPFTRRLSLQTVQLEGKHPIPFSQFLSAYVPEGASKTPR